MHPPSQKLSILSRAATIAVATIMLLQTPAGAVSTLKTLHSFCKVSDCAGGRNPQAGLLLDASGNVYGTTVDGGKYTYGTVFKLVPNADKTKYTEYVIRNFCAKSHCADGEQPFSGVIMDLNGNLYGTTANGGNTNCAGQGCGVVFKLTHGSHGWSWRVLKKICTVEFMGFCAEGRHPMTGLSYAGQESGQPWNGSSPLFGTTEAGGKYEAGVAYELTVSGSTWTYKVIHNFQSGYDPQEVTVDNSGNIYGAALGGNSGGGLLYKLASGTWKETTLHQFCYGCDAGTTPNGRLLRDSSGNLFGTTEEGGTGTECNAGPTLRCGIIYERTAGGTYKVLYNFCSQTNCTDGDASLAGLIIDGSGNLFGTTIAGGTVGSPCPEGANGCGVVFELSSAGAYTVLHAFCYQSLGCPDGARPAAGVVIDPAGNLFGTTEQGGSYDYNGGTVFRLTQ